MSTNAPGAPGTVSGEISFLNSGGYTGLRDIATHPGRQAIEFAVANRLVDGYPHALARDPHLRVHLYGKDLRPGRKVGHVNAYGDDLEDCLERARHAAAWFRGDLGNESE